jgi:replicative DNA helicase
VSVDRVPPHSFDAEQAILGSIMMVDGSYRLLAETLRVEHFADPLHGLIFQVAGAMVDRGDKVTPLTLRPYLEQDPVFSEVGGTAYLARLCANRAPIEHVETLADQVRDLFVRRKAIDAIEAALAEAYRPKAATTAVQQIEAAERDLAQIASLGRKDADERWFRDWVIDVVAQAEAAYQRGAGLAGLSTGFRALDDILGGLRPSDLVILAGRPAMGKSALASNIAMDAAEKYREEIVNGEVAVADGAMVGFWSLEMSGQQLVQRVIAERSSISSSALSSGKVNSADFDRFITVANDYLPMARISAKPEMTITALRAAAHRMKREHRLGLIVVDYLQLVSAPRPGRPDRMAEVSEVTRGLKALAKELNVPVLALAQLSRGVDQRDDKRPQLSDLRESGSIEQDADVVMFVYREAYYLGRAEPHRKPDESDEKFNSRHDAWKERMAEVEGKAEVIVAKHRHGATGSVQLQFEARLTKFSDIVSTDAAEAELPL